MTQEEKAKAYDGALAKAAKIHRNYKGRVRAVDVVIEEVFPELKESEDERIRKALYLFVEAYGAHANYEVTREEMLAWLEKQSKQRPAWTPMDEQRVENLLAIIEGHGYPEEVKWLNSLKDRVQPKQGEQNPAWSEEDMKMVGTLVAIFEVNYPDGFYKVNPIGTTNMQGIHSSEIIKWLKSLRPQNWTKEDKERYVSCLQRLGTGNPKQPETINSKWFKEHVYPQSTWKASDEQMKALADALSLANNCGEENAFDLRTLYEQLKKLREE